MIKYNGFGPSSFGEFHVDTYDSSLIFNLENDNSGCTEALFTSGNLAVSLPSSQAGDAVRLPQKTPCLLSDCGVNPSDTANVHCLINNQLITYEKGSDEFENALHELSVREGVVLHRGKTNKGCVVNIAQELCGNGFDEPGGSTSRLSTRYRSWSK